METFLTVILFIFAGFWLLGVVGRWTLKWWIAKKQREFQQQFGGDAASGNPSGNKGFFRGFYAHFGENGGTRKRKRDGEVTVTETTRRSEYQVGKGVGEYVEYEEVETASVSEEEKK